MCCLYSSLELTEYTYSVVYFFTYSQPCIPLNTMEYGLCNIESFLDKLSLDI
jgi:hypothetical protein